MRRFFEIGIGIAIVFSSDPDPDSDPDSDPDFDPDFDFDFDPDFDFDFDFDFDMYGKGIWRRYVNMRNGPIGTGGYS